MKHKKLIEIPPYYIDTLGAICTIIVVKVWTCLDNSARGSLHSVHAVWYPATAVWYPATAMQFCIVSLQFGILPLQFGILPLQFGILPLQFD
jgi:hypothetical protein